MNAKRWGIAAIATVIVIGSTVVGSSAAYADASAPSTTGVWCRPLPVVVGQTLSCFATVTDTESGAPLPDGSRINFTTSDPGMASQWCLVRGFCEVELSPVSDTVGTLTVTASFDGDSDHLPSSGSTTVEVVAPTQESTTAVSCSPDPVRQGQLVSCTVVVTDTDTGAPVEDWGIVDVALDGDSFGMGVSGDGSCRVRSGTCEVTWQLVPNFRGPIDVTATYWGSSAHLPSTGVTNFSVVEPTALVAKPAIANLVSPTKVNLKLSATLTDAIDGTPIAGETIRFAANGIALCTATTDASGVATCSTPTAVALAADGYKAFFDGANYRVKSSTSGAGVRL